MYNRNGKAVVDNKEQRVRGSSDFQAVYWKSGEEIDP